MHRYGIEIPDPQLACVPVTSPEGQEYLGAMAAAANYGWANRHILAHEARAAFAAVFGLSPEATGMHLVFDVAHNLAKIESRPTKEELGRYIFLADLEGHREDAKVKKALTAIQGQVSLLKIFGSYPRAPG